MMLSSRRKCTFMKGRAMTKKQRTLTTQQKEKIARAKAAYRAWLRRADDLLLATFGSAKCPSGKAAGAKKAGKKRA